MLLGILIPISVILIISFFDSKVNTRDDISRGLRTYLFSEIPEIKNKNILTGFISNSKNLRLAAAEAFRIIISNLQYINSGNSDKKNCEVMLVTSSIKGEGKTFISSNFAAFLSEKKKK